MSLILHGKYVPANVQIQETVEVPVHYPSSSEALQYALILSNIGQTPVDTHGGHHKVFDRYVVDHVPFQFSPSNYLYHVDPLVVLVVDIGNVEQSGLEGREVGILFQCQLAQRRFLVVG